jgi:hypothetical protein
MMPIPTVPPLPPAPLVGAERLTRGVRRALAERGYRSLTEFRLRCGRRADVLAVNDSGEVVIVEVKSGPADFRADQKWPDYQSWCDAFYFAVAADFPADLIPVDCGLMVADEFGALVVREAPVTRLNPARRRSLILAVALTVSRRLHRIEDPLVEAGF